MPSALGDRPSKTAHEPVAAARDSLESWLRPASTGREAAVDRIPGHVMTEHRFNSHLRLASADRMTGRRQRLDDGPLDNAVVKPQRTRRLSLTPAARPRLENTVWKRLENAGQA